MITEETKPAAVACLVSTQIKTKFFPANRGQNNTKRNIKKKSALKKKSDCKISTRQTQPNETGQQKQSKVSVQTKKAQKLEGGTKAAVISYLGFKSSWRVVDAGTW